MIKNEGKIFLIFYIFLLFMMLVTCTNADTGQQKEAARTEIASLNWEGSKLQLFLYSPNGTMISPYINNSKIRHVTGPTYDYYLLSNVEFGQWTLEVVPVDVPVKGETFSLVSGPVNLKELAQKNAKKQTQ